MKNNTNYTKKRLAFVFSSIVFIIFVFLGQLFYLSMYFYTKQSSINAFNWLLSWVKNNVISLEKLWSIDIWNPKDFKQIPLMSYIIFDWNNKITNQKVYIDISKDYIKTFLNSKNFDKVEKIDDYYFWKTQINNKTLIIFIKEDYDLIHVFEDILFFALISFIASVIIYIFLKKFINKLFIPVEENIKYMNEFVHNASHELQTPLSVIVSNIDYYFKIWKTDDTSLFEIKSEAKRLSALIKSLLSLSHQNNEIKYDEVNIFDLISNIVLNLKNEINKKELSLILDIHKNEVITLNQQNLDICLTNIIQNAIKYSKNNTEIIISFKENIISIKDNWVWIDEKNIKKIFDRFYKEDLSRNTDWFWIWLSIVKNLCELNNWKIDIVSQKWAWTTFSLKLNW